MKKKNLLATLAALLIVPVFSVNVSAASISASKAKSIVLADSKVKESNLHDYEVEKDTERKEEKKVPGLTDAEMLCCDIAIHIAHKTAARFEDMADGMEMSTLKQIVRRIEDADPESVVPMLQAMFLARGMVDIAEDLDMLELCSKYDEDTYFVFFDILFDTDIFEWFSIENMFDDFHYEDERRSD